MPRLTSSLLDDPGRPVGRFDERGVHDPGVVGDGPHGGVADEVGEADLPAPGAAQVVVDDLAVDLEQLGRDLPEAGGGGDLEAGRHVGGDAGRRAPQRFARRWGRGGGRARGWCGSGRPRRRLPAPGRRLRAPGRRRPRAGPWGWRARRRARPPPGQRRWWRPRWRRCPPPVDGLGVVGRLGGDDRRAGLDPGGRGQVGGVGLVVGEEVSPALGHRAGVGQVALVHLVDQPGVGPQCLRGGSLVSHGGDATECRPSEDHPLEAPRQATRRRAAR